MDMDILFVGHGYVDITFLVDDFPEGNEKTVARDYTVSFGGNAISAAFACAKLGLVPDVILPLAADHLGKVMAGMAADFNLRVHPRAVGRSSPSLVFPKNGKRAIVRCRDAEYTESYPKLPLTGCKVLHVDGLQPDACLYYLKEARRKNIPTSYDGGRIRPITEEILALTDIAIVSEEFCKALGLGTRQMITDLKKRGAILAAVTRGDKGVQFDDGSGLQNISALPIPKPEIIDTNGAGDIFHGAALYSFATRPTLPWRRHLAFASVASAFAIQHLGNINSCATLKQVNQLTKDYPDWATSAGF